MSSHRIWLAMAFCTGWTITSVSLSGCGWDSGPERAVVSGAVTFNGEPVSEGKIRFTPAKGSTAPTAGGLIVDGKYNVEVHGGVAVGTYNVNIEAIRKIKNNIVLKPNEPRPPFYTPEVSQQYIPPKYNRNTNLTITIEPGSGKITKNFDLTD